MAKAGQKEGRNVLIFLCMGVGKYKKIKAMSSKFLAFVHKSDKILDMLKKEDEIIKLHQSLFEGNSIEGKRNVISSLQEY